MNNYDSVKQLIIDTLTNRANGIEIQPEAHQKMDLAILDYIKEVEAVTTSTLMGIAEVDTAPVQPNDSNVVYIGAILSDSANTYANFRDSNGVPITISTGNDESYLLAFIWNKSYWMVLKLSTSVIAKGDNQQIYYQLKSRKTYASYSDMTSDTSLIGNNGKVISVGEFVTVYNSSDTSKNGLYVRISEGWSFISALNLAITSEINVDETYPLATGNYYTLSTAISAVETALRAISAKIIFTTSAGVKETYQYTDSNIGNWETITNWEIISITGKYGNLGIVTDLNSISRTGNYTAYGTANGVPLTTYSWFVEHLNSSSGVVSAHQRAIAYSLSTIVYERSKIGSEWGSWNLNTFTNLSDVKNETYVDGDVPVFNAANGRFEKRNLIEQIGISNYPEYNPSLKYVTGNVRTYSGKLYVCITDIDTPETWNIAHWEETSINELNEKTTNIIQKIINGDNGDDTEIPLAIQDGYYYDFEGNLQNNVFWVTSKIDLSSKTSNVIKLLNGCRSNYAAKTFFTDVNNNRIGDFIDNIGRELYIPIPDQAYYLYVSSRKENDENTNVTGIPIPTAYYSHQIKSVANLSDISKLDTADKKQINDINGIIFGNSKTQDTEYLIDTNFFDGAYFTGVNTLQSDPNWKYLQISFSAAVYSKLRLYFSCSDTDSARTFFINSKNEIISYISSKNGYDIDIPINAVSLYVSSRKYAIEGGLKGIERPIAILYNGSSVPLPAFALNSEFNSEKSKITDNTNNLSILTTDYNNHKIGVPEQSTEIAATWASGYWDEFGIIQSSTNYNYTELTLTQGYDKIKIKFTDPSGYAAKTFFTDEEDNRIGDFITSYNSGDYNIFDVPLNAKKIKISNRIYDDGGYTGTLNPEVLMLSTEIPRFANLSDISKLDTADKNKLFHFSLDDVHVCFEDLVTNQNTYTSIFDNYLFSKLRTWHETYGIVVSLYCFSTFDFSTLPSKYANDFISNKSWLKISLHDDGSPSFWDNKNYTEAKTYWSDWVDKVMSSIGDFEVIDRCPRLGYFHASLDACKGIRDAKCGALGFLGCDDWSYNSEVRLTNYYLTSDESVYLDNRDRYFDYLNQIIFFKTDFRLEQVVQRWSTINACANYYISSDAAMQAYDMIVFSHESLIPSYYSMAEYIFNWAKERGYRFDYPMNTILK